MIVVCCLCVFTDMSLYVVYGTVYYIYIYIYICILIDIHYVNIHITNFIPLLQKPTTLIYLSACKPSANIYFSSSKTSR